MSGMAPPQTPMGHARTAQTPLKSASKASSFRTPMRPPGEQTSHTPVIDFETIEAQKENVQPLLKGRSAHALNTALSQRQATLKAQRKEHETTVTSQENAESDDPLEAWSRYVKWCIDSYPSGQTHESELLVVLERCTRLFKESPQYQNDSRYLRLWILYARNVDCPSDVYNFLLANEIGTSLASLYEELAVVYEGLSSFEKADETYRLGIHRSAHPLDRLKRRYTEYQKRIVTSEGHSGSEVGSYKTALKQAMSKAQRAMLGQKAGASSMSANSVRAFGGQGGLEKVKAQSSSQNGVRPSIFRDKDGEEIFAKSFTKGGWSDIGTSASRKQESSAEAKSWKGEVLLQREVITPKKPAVAVYRDSDDEDEADDKAAQAVKSKAVDVFSTLSASKEPSETDRLRRNPLAHYDQSSKKPEDKQKLAPIPTKRSKGVSSSSGSKSKQASSSSSRKEEYSLPLALLYPGVKLEEAGHRRSKRERSGEVCLEELIAAKRGCVLSDEYDPYAHLDAIQGKWLPEIKRKEKTIRRDPTVTAFTKEAQDQVMEMFNGGMVDSDDESSDEQSESEEEDEDEPQPRAVQMLKENAAVPPTPTPAPTKGTAHGESAPMMATPVRRPLGEKKKFGERLPQRVEAVDEAQEDQASGEDSEEEYDYLNAPMPEMAPLSPITEATEYTRQTMSSRTPGATASRSWVPQATPSRSFAGLGLQAEREQSAVREEAGEHSLTDTASESAGCGSTWAGSQLGDKDGSSRRMPAGFTIEAGDEDMEEQFNASLIIMDEFPNPCSPVDATVIDTILAGLTLSVESSADYVDCRDAQSGKLSDLQRRAGAVHRRSSSNTSGNISSNAVLNKDWTLVIDGHIFTIHQKLGEGGFGAVFLAEDDDSLLRSKRVVGGINGDASFANVDDVAFGDNEDDDEEDGDADKKLIAIKVETPPNRWEFYILGQLRARLPPFQLASIICARKFFCFRDESFLLLEYEEKGTLLEIVNNSVKAGVAFSSTAAGQATGSVGIDEILAMFFVVEIIKIVESLHAVELLHGDLKIDNCLLRLQEPRETWTNQYDRTGANGWSSKGVTLIDFGKAVDLKQFKPEQRFIADWNAELHDCLEIQQGQTWKYEVDYHGIASIAYCLLFGKYIEMAPGADGLQTIDKPLRRYWQVEIWMSLFRLCLNSGQLAKGGDGHPAIDVQQELSTVRSRMETWLEENCYRAGKNLKGSLKKLEIWSMKRSN